MVVFVVEHYIRGNESEALNYAICELAMYIAESKVGYTKMIELTADNIKCILR